MGKKLAELKALRATVKAATETKKVEAEAKRVADEKVSKSLNELNDTKSTNQGEKKMSLSKQSKHVNALIKFAAQIKSSEEKSAVEGNFEQILKAYESEMTAEGKAISVTTDHTSVLRTTQSSDLIFSFDPKGKAGAILALFNRYDEAVNGTVTLPVDNQDVELQHVGETEDVVEQTTAESLHTLTANRSAMSFKISRSLQLKSIVKQLEYLEGLLQGAVEKGLVEGIINGQGADAAQQDAGVSAKSMAKKMPGIRAKLSAAGLVTDADNDELSGDEGRALMQTLFDDSGAEFSEAQDEYVILAPRAEKLRLSAMSRGTGVTGINPAAATSVYEDKYMGIPVIETAWLVSRTASSGTGVSETGFKSATTANNDHGSLILIKAKKVWYSFGAERIDVEYKPTSDSFEITLNAIAGWNVLVNAKNRPGRMLVNIGADVA